MTSLEVPRAPRRKRCGFVRRWFHRRQRQGDTLFLRPSLESYGNPRWRSAWLAHKSVSKHWTCQCAPQAVGIMWAERMLVHWFSHDVVFKRWSHDQRAAAIEMTAEQPIDIGAARLISEVQALFSRLGYGAP